MKVVISRQYYSDETSGILYVLSGSKQMFKCYTLELPNLNNQKKISCIPEGIYKIEKHTSPTKGKCFKILDVPNRDNILIHKGNFATGKKVDTEGCILVGTYIEDINGDGKFDVAESEKALTRLLEVLPDKAELYII